jgi:hypothetical protein
MQLSRTRRLLAAFGVSLLAMAAMGAVLAGGAQAWVINGKTFTGEETFKTSGSFEMEAAGLGIVFNCSESGTGKIYANDSVEESLTLSGCKIIGAEKSCTVEPISVKVKTQANTYIPGEGVHSVEPGLLMRIVTTGAECAWFKNVEIADPETAFPTKSCQQGGLGLTYGAEAVKLSVSTYACPKFGEHFFYIKGTSTWQLSEVGAHWNEPFAPPTWRIQGTSDPSGAKGTDLRGTACTSSETCVAVGSYTNSSNTTVTLAQVRSSGIWSVSSTPNPSESMASSLKQVSCSAASACSAVGEAVNSKSGLSFGFVDRWNGSTWSLQTMPLPAEGSYYMEDIACPASNECWAVGYSFALKRAPLVMRWNGTSWSLYSFPLPEGAGSAGLNSITCVSSSNCWVVGWRNKPFSGLAEHWNGTTWTDSSPAEFGLELTDVSCGSGSSCLATAWGESAAVRWNGSSWSKETLPKPEGAESTSQTGASCFSATACTVVGTVNIGGVTQPLALGWNGSSWSLQNTSFPTGQTWARFDDVSCTSATECTTVGSSYKSPTVKALVETRH